MKKQKTHPALRAPLILLLALAAWICVACGGNGGSGGEEDAAGDDGVIDTVEDIAADDATQEAPEDVVQDDAGEEDEAAGEEPETTCDPMTDRSCIMLKEGETEYFRFFESYETIEFNDEGTVRTVVRLWELVDEDITPDPDRHRYKIYGTDGYTHSDYLYWENFLGGYIETGTRKVVFEPEQELPHLFRVKDAYMIVLLPL